MASPTHSEATAAAEYARQQQHDPTFTMQWQPTDTSSLQPAHLSLNRVPRAWERKPLIPFSRSKMRVGKVWKRTAPVEIRSNRPSLGGASGKPIKKMRLDGDGAVGVARWDGDAEDASEFMGSPARKIVLRRDRVGEEGLVELPEEDEEDARDEEDAVVEVFDEDGTLQHVDSEDVAGQRDWEDEEEEFNPTMMHLGNIVELAQRSSDDSVRQAEIGTGDDASAEEPTAMDEIVVDQQLEEAAHASTESTLQSTSQTSQVREVLTLPEGFVSPVKQNSAPKPASSEKLLGSRRRTLPTEWRPSRLRQVMNVDETPDESASAAPEMAAPEEILSEDAKQDMQLESPECGAEQDVEQEWEDVEEGEYHADFDAETDRTVYEARVAAEEIEQERQAASETTIQPVEAASPIKLPSSPVPSVDGQHPRLPLRRSPRRKSSSPVKQSAIRPSTEQSHLVAFTPIKGLGRLPDFTASPFADHMAGQDHDEVEPPLLLERSISAPPEEPAISPHRPTRPRVSDDTALLQAFLHRAAESKNPGRRVSATKRESITNRRDSDAVRQALASPAKPEVLADLDPNSPSPRKPSVASDEIDNANILPEPESSPLQKTRRSGRATRKAAPQTATPAAAPNKISIRGNSENVVLKKSEAQELSQVTRTNTRKNKGTAVLPLYRLAKLQQQGIVDPLDDGTVLEGDVEPKPNSKGRALRWNETLVEVWQGGDVSETSLLSDELSAPASAPAEEERMDAEAEASNVNTTAPPPAETPSKPRIRRLKATRTAATPGKAPSAPVDRGTKADEIEKVEPAAPQPKAPTAASKRRSRIATPAKGLSSGSLLPADLEPTPAPAPAQQQPNKKSIPTPTAAGAKGKRKPPPTSKLPAPATTTTTTTSTTAALGQGKENLISSPAKKKPSTAMPSSKTFAPKLDLGKSQSLGPGGSQEDAMTTAPAMVPGLASPAKKVGRRGGVVFAPASSSAGIGAQQEDEAPPLGLRSPAKKRTRRAVAAGGGR